MSNNNNNNNNNKSSNDDDDTNKIKTTITSNTYEDHDDTDNCNNVNRSKMKSTNSTSIISTLRIKPLAESTLEDGNVTQHQWKPKMPRWLSAPPLGQHGQPKGVWRNPPLPWVEMDQVDYIPELESEGNYTHFKQPQEDDVLAI